MGCKQSAPIETYSSQHSQAEDSVTEWKVKVSITEARRAFEEDGTLPKDCAVGQLELRALLSEPVSQPIIGNYAKRHAGFEFFMCWIDIQEYKAIEAEAYRLSKALHVYNKYIEEGSILDVKIEEEERNLIRESLQVIKSENMPMSNTFYNGVQRKCFVEIYEKIFLFFKKTEDYQAMTKLLKETYNYVRTEDFEYCKKLGQGGFGLVVHVIKKSTKQHYAMKIQTKKGLLSCFPDDPWRADYERQALAGSSHPFIVSLEYAFQTDSLAIMVLSLGTAGDLRQQLRISPGRVLTVDRVQFYAAEMILALAHIHSMGMMYRDLKPNNVLLNADGHIQLVDLGAVADVDGITLGKQADTDGLAPVFNPQFEKRASADEINTQFADPTVLPAATSAGASVIEQVKTQQRELQVALEERFAGAVYAQQNNHSSDSNNNNNNNNNVMEFPQSSAKLPTGSIHVDDDEKEEVVRSYIQYTRKSQRADMPIEQINGNINMNNMASPQYSKSGEKGVHNNGTNSGNVSNMPLPASAHPYYDPEEVVILGPDKPPLKRALTIIGTYGYMAPEMVVILSQEPHEKVGYTKTVDWWSLGATIYKLLTNAKPFNEFSLKKLIEVAPLYKGDMKFVSRYAILFQEIPDHPNITPLAMDIIRKLLNVDGNTRLGSGKNGVRDIKAHPFFKTIDWELLESRLLVPPYIPPPKPLNTAPQHASFYDMMKALGKDTWITDVPKWNQQRYFSNWDFTSPGTLKLECNVASEMNQFDNNFKSMQQRRLTETSDHSTAGLGYSLIFWGKKVNNTVNHQLSKIISGVPKAYGILRTNSGGSVNNVENASVRSQNNSNNNSLKNFTG